MAAIAASVTYRLCSVADLIESSEDRTMAQVYRCEHCHNVIDGESGKYLVYKDGTIYEMRLHEACVEAYLFSRDLSDIKPGWSVLAFSVSGRF
jgi:hypothetical protein